MHPSRTRETGRARASRDAVDTVRSVFSGHPCGTCAAGRSYDRRTVLARRARSSCSPCRTNISDTPTRTGRACSPWRSTSTRCAGVALSTAGARRSCGRRARSTGVSLTPRRSGRPRVACEACAWYTHACVSLPTARSRRSGVAGSVHSRWARRTVKPWAAYMTGDAISPRYSIISCRPYASVCTVSSVRSILAVCAVCARGPWCPVRAINYCSSRRSGQRCCCDSRRYRYRGVSWRSSGTLPAWVASTTRCTGRSRGSCVGRITVSARRTSRTCTSSRARRAVDAVVPLPSRSSCTACTSCDRRSVPASGSRRSRGSDDERAWHAR